MKDGQLSIERIASATAGLETMRLTGPITLSTLFEMQESFRRNPQPNTIVDMSGVPYMDSAGLGALLTFHGSCKRTGRNYVLAAMVPRVHSMFSASKVDRLVNIASSVAEAEVFLSLPK